jgi:hypothetical protein
MKYDLYKKGLVLGIIVLFIGISTIPEINAVDGDTDDLIDKSINNFEIKSFDDYEEIITLITGGGHINWIKRKGLFRGEILIETCPWCKGINLIGLRHSNGSIELFREYNLEFPYGGPYLHIPSFIGWARGSGIEGIAIGDIDINYYPPFYI